MGCAGGFLDEEAILVGRAVDGRGGPELGLRKGGVAEVLQAVDGRRVRATSLWVDAETIGSGAGSEAAVVVFSDEVGGGAADIGEETVTDVAAVDDATGEDGEVGTGS